MYINYVQYMMICIHVQCTCAGTQYTYMYMYATELNMHVHVLPVLESTTVMIILCFCRLADSGLVAH